MKCRAKVTLGGALVGLHGHPCSKMGLAIQGTQAQVSFSRGGRTCVIDASYPTTSLMAAASVLGLAGGAEFSVTCQGPDAPQTMARLETVMRSAEFRGTVFEELANE